MGRELEICQEGDYLTVFLPPVNQAIVFWVKSVLNKGREVMDYGPLPLASGTTLPTYDGASTTVPADGVLPGRSYADDLSFPMKGGYEERDMWYLPPTEGFKLFHVIQYVTPAWLRVEVRVPRGVPQSRFQSGRIMTGVDKDFGFSRGVVEAIHLPGIHYGYRYGNETNIDVHTFVKFVYGEYAVEIPRNPELIFDVLVRRVRSRWFSLPVWSVAEPEVSRALREAYGFDAERRIYGFRLYRHDQRDEAIREYSEILKGLKA